MHTATMGYNPYRKYSATRIDYLLVAIASLVAIGAFLWGLFG
ncbi:MAG: hypothetical protein QF637_13960 [Acidimicrobiales bacterium]|nr:hypothetical protein [Acidimicrobiales bacterium]